MTNSEAIAQLDPQLFDELQRLWQRHAPLLPSDIPLGQLTTVLDVGCGKHQWGKALFRTMVEMVGLDLLDDVRIEGLDHRPELVQEANMQMRVGRGHVSVFEGDLFHLPATRTARYDLVHLRFLSPFLAPQSWPVVLQTLVRVCKPGGWVVWSEPKLPTSGEQTPGWNQWLEWSAEAITCLGGSPQISMSMEALFQQAGPWQEVHAQTLVLPLISAASEPGFLLTEQYQRVRRWMLELCPVLIAGGIPATCLDQILPVVLHELNRRSVISMWEWKMMVGRLPRRSARR